MRIFFQKTFRWFKILVLFFFVFSLFIVILYRFLPPPVTPLMIIRLNEQLWEKDKKMKLQKEWKSIEKISPNIIYAVMASEDQKFLDHNGFDWDAIKKAYEYNTKKSNRRPVKGASTISQQTAKNVFLWPGRSWVRKGFEVYFTFLIELFWSKDRIMEVYLNVIEMGDGVYGAEAASRTYFRKSALQLNKDNAAAIAAILPNPRKYSASKPGPYIQRRKEWIKRNMDYLKRERRWGKDFF
jgi:monofunctional biosynthetic peptidoglycan transglycosylase